MMGRRIAVALLATAGVAGAGEAIGGDVDMPQRLGAHGLALPATFTGVLPCADCPGIRHHLDLWPDEGGFALRREWLDRDARDDRLGRWYVDPARGALVLYGDLDPPIEWQILAGNRLRLLDLEGNPIESDLPYELLGEPLAPTDIAAPMTGLFTYFADATLLTECLTGQRFPVMMEEDYPALERAYLEARPAPAAPLLARIDGRIAKREAMEGPPRRSVTVERFHHVTPHGACAEDRAPADAVGTYWRILALGDGPLPEMPDFREPHLLLRDAEDGPRFSGTVGCNMMLGGYELSGDRLAFGAVASTMMACPPPLDELERSFAAALEAIASFESDGRTLRLRDADGRVHAELEAAYTRY